MKQANLGLTCAVAVGFVACAFAANGVYDSKITMEPFEARAPTQFYAGMDKFLSNVSWMTLIQWEAQNSGKLTEAQAQSMYRKLDSLTNLDPLFADAYLDGALILAPYHQEEARQLLEKGMKLGLGNRWKLPFYAAMVEKSRPNGDVHLAIVYLDQAEKLPGAPFYLGPLQIRWQVAQMSDRTQALDTWCGYFGHLTPEQVQQRTVAITEINFTAQDVIAGCNSDLEQATDPAARDAIIFKRTHAEKCVKDYPAGPITAPHAPAGAV